MRKQYLGSAAALSLTIFLSACGGGGSSGSGGGSTSSSASSGGVATEPTSLVSADITQEEAVRLAKQASFGPTPDLMWAIVGKKSAASWLDGQFGISDSTYADLAAKAVAGNICSTLTGAELTNCNRDNFSATPMQMRFYANALGKDDQLRQRVAFALSQIIVTSDRLRRHTTAGLATFDQILLSNAFGNYRDVLEAVTLNPLTWANT
jgi:uncharacterized protein (DUF1800 family)